MTKFHFAGRYNGDPESLITHEHEPDSVPFKEATDMNKMALIMNGIALLIGVVTMGLYMYLSRTAFDVVGVILSLVVMVPHEFLHAICFEGEVYMYENLRKGMLFVAGPETFSKGRFIFMSLF